MELKTPLILVIDDSEDIREVFQLALEAAGYRVRVAADGREGLNIARECRPDLILTDISMPVMNGLQFLVQLRSDVSPPLPPVVVCSGFDVTAEEALKLGAVRFVAKPIERASLVRIVEEALHGRPAGESVLAHERAFVKAARARAAAAAERLFETLEAQAAALDRALPVLAQFVSDYFGFATAGILFVDGGGIRLAAVSRGSSIPAGSKFSGNLLFSTGVLAGGSSLVVTDATCYLGAAVMDPQAVALGLNFIVAVPLLFDGVPIGAIALFDFATHPFEAEDLLILEGIGRDASQGLRHTAPIGTNLGFFLPPLFDRMLEAELSLLHRKRGGLELILVETEQGGLSTERALEILSSGSSRFAIGRRDGGIIATYKRDADAVAARRTLSAALSTLVAAGGVGATGWVSVKDAGLPQVSHDVVLRLASFALDQSRSTGGRVEHMVLGAEPLPDATAASVPPTGVG